MSDMQLNLDEDFSHSAYVDEVVRPVGPWRFLTPIDTVQVGDLFRTIPVGDSGDAYETNWSAVHDHHEVIGDTPRVQKGFEFIRAYDDTAYTVPMFKG